MAAKKQQRAARPRGWSAKDIQIAYLMNGVRVIEEAVQAGKASKASVRGALKQLQDAGRNVEAFERWVFEAFGAPGSGRGRSAPEPGATRLYRAQQVKTGGPFLRLPLDVLQVKKGGTIQVRFEGSQIVVTR